MRGRAPAPAVVQKRKIERAESKMLSAPLVSNATDGLSAADKTVTGCGESGPTRFSAADIPLEDQQIVSRDPDIIQRPAKAPRVRRAPTARGEPGAAAEESQAPAPEPPPADEGGSLLARLLAGRKSTTATTPDSSSR